MAIVSGTNASEILDAADGVTNGNDTIFGNGGNDIIFGLGGNDWIYGDDGNDAINGGSGSDILSGGTGADILEGGSGTDLANYSSSSAGVTVYLTTGQGFGGDAEGDTLANIESIQGSWFDDFLVGNDGNNTLYGFYGNDTLKGGGGADTLDGFNGNDILKGGGGGDTLNGGAGIDTADYFESSTGVFISLITDDASGGDAAGDDLNSIENVNGSAYSDTMWGSDGTNVLNGRGGSDILKGLGGADTLYGGDAGDQLFGGDGNDVLFGDAGNDWLFGDAGNDILNGGAGVDTMDGGADSDTYYVDNAGDAIVDNSGSTYETVYTSVSYTLAAGADVELFETTDDAGVSALNLTGNASSQEIQGNNGDNTINGASGNDVLVGFGGADVFLFNSALDGSFNVDTIADFNQADDFIALDNAIFTGLVTEADHYLIGTEFHIGSAAGDADDRIIYDASTGALFYDSDGTGGAAQIQFATLAAGMALVNDDFIVV